MTIRLHQYQPTLGVIDLKCIFTIWYYIVILISLLLLKRKKRKNIPNLYL